MREFTQDEKNEICGIIGTWYVRWKRKMLGSEPETHRLGYAKEELKDMICDGKKVSQFPQMGD